VQSSVDNRKGDESTKGANLGSYALETREDNREKRLFLWTGSSGVKRAGSKAVFSRIG